MALSEPALSDYAKQSITPAPVAQMMDSFSADFREGEDVNLGVGYVNEQTLPREPLREAVSAVLADPKKHKNALNYGSGAGSSNLAKSVRAFLARSAASDLTEAALNRHRLIFGANGATSLLEGIAAAVHRGVVITSDPLYYIYSSFLTRLGFQLLSIPEDHEGLRTDLLEQRLPSVLDEVSFFYVVTVGNPSASVLSNRRRQDLLRIATKASHQLGRKVPLIFDGAYDLLRHDPSLERPRSVILDDREGISYELGTFSKVLAPSLRVGYLLGPPGPLMDVLVQRNNDTGLGASLFNQEITSHLLDHFADEQVRVVNEGYRKKARVTRSLLESELGDAIEELVGGQAGFYYYVTLRDVPTGEGTDFHRYCTRTTGDSAVDGPRKARNPRVVYIPGAFCVHPTGDLVERGQRQLRLSYGFEPLSQIERGIGILRDAVAHARARN